MECRSFAQGLKHEGQCDAAGTCRVTCPQDCAIHANLVMPMPRPWHATEPPQVSVTPSLDHNIRPCTAHIGDGS